LLKDGLDLVNKVKQAEQDLDDLIAPFITAEGAVQIKGFYQALKDKLK
jgi:hypothetical protein